MDDNLPSSRLAERVGFRLDRVVADELEVKGSLRTIKHYIMTADDYRALRKI